MYGLDIEIARDNPSIIVVNQGDVMGASDALVKILNKESALESAEDIIQRIVGRFNDDNYENDMIDLVYTYNKTSKYNFYPPEIYLRLIKYATFYAGRPMPA